MVTKEVVFCSFLLLIVAGCTNAYQSCSTDCKNYQFEPFLYNTTCEIPRSEVAFFHSNYGSTKVICEKVADAKLEAYCNEFCRGSP